MMSPQTKRVLTITQRKIIKYCYEFWKENHYSPSVREIGYGVGLKSTSSVFNQLKSIQRKGYFKIHKTGKYSDSRAITYNLPKCRAVANGG